MENLMGFLTEVFSNPSFKIGAMVAILGFCLILIISKRLISAFIFFVLFLLMFFSWLSGPMGIEVIQKVQKHSQTFHSADE